MGSDYSTSTVGFNSVPNVSGVAPGQVMMPYQMTAPYPCDEFVSSRKKKSHTGLIATVVGLLAAGGAIYACKGKSEGAQKIVTATEKFFTEVSEGFKKLFDDIGKWFKGEKPVGGKPKEVPPSKAVTEARGKVPPEFEAAVKKAEETSFNPAIKAVDKEIDGIIKPAQGASKISEATLKEIDAAADTTAKLGAVGKRIEELGKIDPKDLTPAQQEELDALTRLQKLLECKKAIEEMWLKLLQNLHLGKAQDIEIKAIGTRIDRALNDAKVELPKAAEPPAEPPKEDEPKKE